MHQPDPLRQVSRRPAAAEAVPQGLAEGKEPLLVGRRAGQDPAAELVSEGVVALLADGVDLVEHPVADGLHELLVGHVVERASRRR